MNITAEEIVRLFEEDVRARRRLAELLMSEPDVRLALANAILREVATKEDLRGLRDELKTYMDAKVEGLEKRVNGVDQRVSDLAALVRASLIAIVVTLASTILTPLILKLLGLL
ncbi:MAG TPA: hypothetical protein ENF80_04460 [Thermofilum sp.]|nr:hypothetical protein [Thermofilum sp.]